MPLSSQLHPVAFADLPGWASDDHLAAFGAFRRSALQVLAKPYRAGSLGLEFSAFVPAYEEARNAVPQATAAARSFFERHFTPARMGTGLVTGFYEPEAQASPVRTDHFRYPLFSRPVDLIDVNDVNRPEHLDVYLAFARDTPNGPVEYHDRAAIETGVLQGSGLELAWLLDKVDLFFIHVQGAARLIMPDGMVKRVTYAAKSGHQFSGPGRILADLGEIPLEDVTMQSIRSWFRRNPDRIDEILHQNRSFIFFREAPVDDPAWGPVAAAKVPLTAGRSMAVDRLLHTFGTPIYIDAPTLLAFGDGPFRRLMIAQDTGSAIVGAARGDLFAGSGNAAGEVAGVVRHDADFHVLVPKSLVQDSAR